jgi:hypothetical protein
MLNHHPPTRIRIAEDHPILGLDAMLPMVLHHPRSEFDEIGLLRLLRTSFSLNLEEKLKILERLSVMSQAQVDHLTEILVDEHEKFEFITNEFPEDVAELVEERMKELSRAVSRRCLFDN